MRCLALWVEETPPDVFLEATGKESDLGQLREGLSRVWRSNAFSQSPWIEQKVAEELGANYEGPYTKIIDMLEERWSKIGRPPEFVKENMADLRRPGYPHFVTVRHRISKNTERKEQEGHERMLERVYEGYY